VRSDVSFLDDDAALGVVDGVHCVDNLLDLRVVQVLHEVVAQDRFSQQLFRPVSCHHSPTGLENLGLKIILCFGFFSFLLFFKS